MLKIYETIRLLFKKLNNMEFCLYCDDDDNGDYVKCDYCYIIRSLNLLSRKLLTIDKYNLKDNDNLDDAIYLFDKFVENWNNLNYFFNDQRKKLIDYIDVLKGDQND